MVNDLRNSSRVQRFKVQGSAQPLASEAASLIEKETFVLKFHTRGCGFTSNLNRLFFFLACKKVLHRSTESALSRQGGAEFQDVLDRT